MTLIPLQSDSNPATVCQCQYTAVSVLRYVSTERCQYRAVSVHGSVCAGLCQYWAVSVQGGVSTRRCLCWAVSVQGGVCAGLCLCCVSTKICLFWAASVLGCVSIGRCLYWVVSVQGCVCARLCLYCVSTKMCLFWAGSVQGFVSAGVCLCWAVSVQGSVCAGQPWPPTQTSALSLGAPHPRAAAPLWRVHKAQHPSTQEASTQGPYKHHDSTELHQASSLGMLLKTTEQLIIYNSYASGKSALRFGCIADSGSSVLADKLDFFSPTLVQEEQQQETKFKSRSLHSNCESRKCQCIGPLL